VDFTFSPEHDALRDTVRGFLAGPAGPDYRRAMLDEPDGFRADVWSEMASLGWCGILVPEEDGGLGLGLVDAMVVLEETGRVAMPGPYLSAAVLVPLALRAAGASALFEGVADGTVRGAVALDELGHGDPVDRIRTRATRRGATWRLDGLKPLVLDGATADWFLVAARTAEGIGSFVVERAAADMEPVPTMDPTRRAARLHLDGAPARPVGHDGDHTAAWRRIVDDGAVALAAELVGVCDGALAMALDYAQSRVQFDRPIASHQVIQHKLVDMLHRTELGRVGVHFAAWASDADDPERARAAAIAKASMAEAAIATTNDNIQVHGAVGFTWDCDAHLLSKRSKQNDQLLGYHGWHRSRVADAFLGA
jgi:alkylation response protein AidB-like acyl-CoA dehydrogenase